MRGIANMNEKIVVEDVYKIFGPNPEIARRMISEGLGKDEIFERTGHTIGTQQASFTIHEGEIFVIMGLSGSGKSTMVRMLNRLIEPTYGTVKVDGQDITRMSHRELIALRRRDMSMVFQSFALMPHQTVLHNAAFGLEVTGMPRRERDERALRALEQVGLKANAGSYPDELSGGMKQRVGLARALAVDPTILLMDEAFSALDPLIRTQMQDELLQLQREQRRTIVFISHDLDEAMRIGDRIAIMEEGRVVQIGTPQEIVTRPADDYVRSFFHGVDVTQVFNAGDIAARNPEAIDVAQTQPAQARDLVLTHPDGGLAAVDAAGRYLGMLTRDSIARASEGAGPDAYRSALVEDVEVLAADTALGDLLGRVASAPWPLPVVDADGRLVGSISKSGLLETLDRAG